MNIQKVKIFSFVFSCLLLNSQIILSQSTTNTNSFPATNSAYVGSSTVATPLYKLYVGGSIRLYHTGNSGISSPSLYLINTSASGKKYFLNSDNAGSFKIMDSTLTIPRFSINTNGKIAIGLASSTAWLQLPAGSAGAAAAPLKFTSGTNQTTAEAGAMEYNGTNLFFTPTAGSRKTIAFTDFSNVSTAMAADKGGTGFTTYANGDLLYGSATSGLLKLAPGTNGQVLTLTGGVPVWATPAAGSTGWSLTGNAGTTPGTNFIGTTDAQRIALKTNNTEWATLLANGNFGIGTTNPTDKLHVAGNITSPGSGTGSEKFGNSSDVGSNNYSVAIGNNAVTLGNESVAIGYNSKTAATSVAIGNSAQATGFASTLIGHGASDGGTNYKTAIGAAIINPGYFSGGSYLNSGMINIGYNNNAASYNYTHLIGANLAADRANQMLIGNGLAGGFLLDMVLGGGLSNGLASNYGPLVIRTTDGTGTDVTGMSLSLKAGKSTGLAAGGSISFFTTPQGLSGSTVNTEVERMKIDGSGAISFNGLTGNAGQVLTSSGPGAAPVWVNAGSSGTLTLSAIGNTPNTNGATIASSVLSLQPASISFGGVVSTSTQTFAGEKSFMSDIKANDITIGRGSGGSVFNVAMGYQALMSNNFVENTAIGYQALQNNTTGSNNTAVGAHSMKGMVNGYNNVAVGSDVMVNNTSGFNNSSLGYQALRNVTGSGNTGAGAGAGFSITSGTHNTVLGVGSVSGITTGNNNTIIGARVSGLPGDLSNNIILADGQGNRRINVDENGNVGIGTNTISYKLHVQDNNSGLGAILIENPNPGNWLTYSALILKNDLGNPAVGGIVKNSSLNPSYAGVSSLNIIQNSAEPIGFVTNNLLRAMITSDGNVGIGTSAPKARLDVNGTVAIGAVASFPTTGNYKLAVAGDVIAEKIKVKIQSNGWPDYVFEPHYKLPSLSQLEAYIKANQHLPEVPSAEDVKKNGIDLGDNQAVLLKKIEELTLYIIEQQKKAVQQQAAIDKMQQQLNNLQLLIPNK